MENVLKLTIRELLDMGCNLKDVLTTKYNNYSIQEVWASKTGLDKRNYFKPY